jgi:hypothetical protein
MATQQKSRTTRSAKASSRRQLQTVRALREARRKLGRTLAANRRKYLEQPLGQGARLLAQTWKDPFETARKTVDGVQGWVNRLRSEPQRSVQRQLQGGWRRAGEVGRDVYKTLDAVATGGYGVLGAISEDTRQAIDALTKGGRRSIEGFPAMAGLGRNLNRRLQAIPERLDLATKKDIQKLTQKVAALDAKMARLSQPSPSGENTGPDKASPVQG